MREKEAELDEQAKELEGARQQAKETEAVVQRLQPMIQERDKEIEVHTQARTHTHNDPRVNWS